MGNAAYNALEWITANLSRFNPFNDNASTPHQIYQTAITELALICNQFDRKSIKLPDIDKCIEFIEKVYKQPAFYLYPYEIDKRAFIGHLVIWLTLNHREIKPPLTISNIQGFIKESGITSLKRPAFRTLELHYFLEKGGFKHDLPDENALFCKTFLGSGRLEPLSYEDMYDVTHTIFYITDFGERQSDIFEDNKENIINLIMQMITIALNSGNWDLLGELILSWYFLKFEDNMYINKAVKALEQVQDNSGFIPGLCFSDRELSKIATKKARDEYLFLRCYHPSLVMAMTGLL